MIKDVQKGLSDFFGRDVSVTWMEQPWEDRGFSVDGFYRIEIEGKHMDVAEYTFNNMLPPYNKLLTKYLESIKRSLDKKGEYAKSKGHRVRPSFLRYFKLGGFAGH